MAPKRKLEQSSDVVRGPTSEYELNHWHESMWASIMNGPLGAGRMKRLQLHLKRKLVVTTEFSGFDVPRFSVEQAMTGYKAVCKEPVETNPFLFVSACDVGAMQQRFLTKLSMQRDKSKSCVFGDIESAVPAAERVGIDSFMPAASATTAESKPAYRAMRKHVLENAASIFPTNSASPCKVHHQLCPVVPAHVFKHPLSSSETRAWWTCSKTRDTYKEALQANMASTMCSGWSPAGNRSGEGHVSERSHSVSLGQRLALAQQGNEDVYFHENRPEYPVDDLQRQPLKRTHGVVSVVVDPDDIGEPLKRKRRLTCGFDQSKFIYVGEPENARDDFMAIFGRSTETNGNIFLNAVESVFEDFKEFAFRNHVYLSNSSTEAMSDLSSILSPEQRSRVRAWAARAKAANFPETAGWFADIQDWPRGHLPKETMPPFLKSSMMYSNSRRGLVTTHEGMRCHGFRSGPDNKDACSDWVSVFSNSKLYERQALIGGSVHAPLYAAWVFFCLSNLVERKLESPPPLLCDQDFTDDDPE